MSNDEKCALRRLYRDWKEIEAEKENSNIRTITALPTKNMFVWHCNLRPDDGPFRGTIIHLVLMFPPIYPKSPPKVHLCTSLLGHPNVYGDWICLDMIQEYYTTRPYAGWTSAYSVLSILLQLQSFLFAENIPQIDLHGVGTRMYNDKDRISLSIKRAKAYCCHDIVSHDGTIVVHTHDNPWPPFESHSKPPSVDSPSSAEWMMCGYTVQSINVDSTLRVSQEGAEGMEGIEGTEDVISNLIEIDSNIVSNDDLSCTTSSLCSVDSNILSNDDLSSTTSSLCDQMETLDTMAPQLTKLSNDDLSSATSSLYSVDVIDHMETLDSLAHQLTKSFTEDTLTSSVFAAKEDDEQDSYASSVFVPKDEVKSTTISKGSEDVSALPSDVCTHIFSFLGPKDLLRVRDVCSHWRRVVFTYNIFDRSQIMCYHSKATLDDPDTTILGFGLTVRYYPDGKNLKDATSPLDLLSWHAFHVQNVRTGVWDGEFDHFLPLIFDKRHASKALPVIKETIFEIMKNCELPGLQCKTTFPHPGFHPHMAFQLLSVLMNSMVVELMKSSSSSSSDDVNVRRYASEKALEGYCAFHHMLLYFAKIYPCLLDLANGQIESFFSSEEVRTKRHTPNLGLLLVSLTLTCKGWDVLRKPLSMEIFDRNVRWLLQKCPALGNLNGRNSLSDDDRLIETFIGARTSLRLLMFQVYFMSTIGRPSGTKGPFDVLVRYEKRLGKPTMAQKETLLKNAKEILAVNRWVQFFDRIGCLAPPKSRLVQILKQAVVNSARKKYHRLPRMEERGGGGFNHSGALSLKLFVGNLSFETSEDTVRGIFEEYGEVTDCYMPTDRESGRPRGFAFVTMKSSDAENVCGEVDGQEVDGRSIRVNKARAREDRGSGSGYRGA